MALLIDTSEPPMALPLADWPETTAWDDSPAADGVGLVNEGNTCYQNCILQSLMNNSLFTASLTRDHNNQQPEDGLRAQLVALLQSYRTRTASAISAHGVRTAMENTKQWTDGKQHDSHEFLTALLEELDGQSAERKDTKRQKVDRSSAVNEVFAGLMRSRLVCTRCHTVTTSDSPFRCLTLSLPIRVISVAITVVSTDDVISNLLLKDLQKFSSVTSLRQRLRKELSLDTSHDILLALFSRDGRRVQNTLTDCQLLCDFLSNDSQLTATVVKSRPATGAPEPRLCLICLERHPDVLRHSEALDCTFCALCLDECQRYYGQSFVCPNPECRLLVTRERFSHCRPEDNFQTIPLLFRSRDDSTKSFKLIHRALLLSIQSQPTDASQLYALVDAHVRTPHCTYSLRFVESNGIGCCRCSWGSDCDGCEVSRDGLVQINSSDCLAVTFEEDLDSDWPSDDVTTTTTDDRSDDTREELPLERLLAEFVAEETLQCQCLDCQQMVAVRKQLSVLEAPETLVLVVKRFLFLKETNSVHKLQDSVLFPADQPLDLSALLTCQPSPPLLYRLQALVLHSGRSATSGHYTCFARQTDDSWLHFNDESVRRESPDAESRSRAYILFLARCASS